MIVTRQITKDLIAFPYQAEVYREMKHSSLQCAYTFTFGLSM